MRLIVRGAAAFAFLIAGGAFAQGAPPAPPASTQPPITSMSGDAAGRWLDRQDDYRRLDKDVAGSARSLRQYRARPKDIVQGAEVRDADGLVVGTISKVDGAFAVVTGPVGSVEVEATSLARNKNGLLINLPKAKIDPMMARKPAG